jgi:uncharacterized membrane protein
MTEFLGQNSGNEVRGQTYDPLRYDPANIPRAPAIDFSHWMALATYIGAVKIAEGTKLGFGSRIYGLGLMAMGLACLAFREFDPGQPVPDNFPYRTILAYVAGAFIVVAAAAVEWRRTAAWGAAALALYYGVVVVILLDGRQLLAQYAGYGIYESLSMQLALTLGGLLVYVSVANIDATLSARLTRLCQLAFGICALIWGRAHFVYMNFTAPLVPKWLPPSQVFWGYVTGVCFIAAGLAILTGIKARLAAILLTVMIACFGLLVNDRILLTGVLSSHWNWSESSINLALIGVAWLVADSLPRSKG